MIHGANEKLQGQRQYQSISTLLKRKSAIIPKQQKISLQEITRDLLDRQNEYDKLNKVYTSVKFNHKVNSLEKNSKFFTMKNAVREAKLKCLQNPDCYHKNIQNNENQCLQQQKHSIALIAQIFRNQKSTLCLRSNHQNQQTKKWNLQLILIITIPMICLLILIFEYKELK